MEVTPLRNPENPLLKNQPSPSLTPRPELPPSMVLTRLSPSLIFLLNLLQERYHFHLGKMLEILFGGGGTSWAINTFITFQAGVGFGEPWEGPRPGRALAPGPSSPVAGSAEKGREERQGDEFPRSAGACFSLEPWLRAAAPCSSGPLRPPSRSSRLRAPRPRLFLRVHQQVVMDACCVQSRGRKKRKGPAPRGLRSWHGWQLGGQRAV